MLIFFDDYCPLCLGSKSFLEKIDFSKKLQFIGIRQSDTFSNYPMLDKAAALDRMASLQKDEIKYGFDSIYRIVFALPLLWIFIPFFFILKWVNLGHWAYDQIASRRGILPFSCDENCAIDHPQKP